ncbi:Sugar transport system, permease protein [Candidatus Phytoplasma australiense]|uniref:Sugar transport system, permease protein n=1 Tax=Phytoplasma australiense TaxID=59748 RepID=B1V8X1_PHYAS|nr:Sugar transport system, permease protein [Candidatus Phytoplasma australiense]
MNKIQSNLLILKRKAPSFFFIFVKYFFLFFVLLFLALPFYWMLNVAFQKDSLHIHWYPKNFTIEHFKNVLVGNDKIGFLPSFLVTILVVFLSTILGIIVSVITAFALSILQFKNKRIVFSLFLITTMITTESMFLINYQTVARLGLVDPGNGSIVPGGVYFAMVLPFLINFVHIFLLMQNIKKIPKELYLSVKIDGSSNFNFLFKILIPLLKDNLINIVIFRAVAAWNAYLWPQLVGGKLLTVIVRNFFDSDTKPNLINQQMAATTLITVPLVLLFIFCKKYVLEGNLNSGIKG